MKGASRFIPVVVFLLCVFSLAAHPGDADPPNFTGKYVLQGKHTSGDTLLEVVQNPGDVEVTRTSNGKQVTNRYPQGGNEGNYTSPGGIPGKCKASLKGKQLILESVVTTHPQPQVPPMREHEKQKWQLSDDLKILTIQTDVDFPDVRPDVSALVGGSFSGKEKYVRVQSDPTSKP
jgi:hypothetical protein